MSFGADNHSVVRSLIVVAIWCALSRPERALAQGDPAFDIKKRASPNPVVAGDELTYIITLRNLAGTPQRDVVVLDRLPDRVQVLYYGVQGDGKWVAGVKDERRVVMWIAQEPLSPGAEVTFTIVVRVEPDARGPLVNDDYGVGVGKAEVTLRGAAVRTEVIVPTPTPTPTLLPTRIPSPTPIMPRATATSTRHVLPSATPTLPLPLSSPTARGEPVPSARSWVPIAVVGGSISVIFALLLIGRFLRKRG